MLVSDPFAHTEFQFSMRHNGISHSSTMQGKNGFNGSRFENIDYLKHPERWVSLILPMTDLQEARGYDRAWEIDGMPYDTVGVTSLTTGWDIIKPDPDKLWCSEDVAEIIKASYQYGDDFVPDTHDPRSLLIEMIRRLYDAKLL
jgi:hypothetical protein